MQRTGNVAGAQNTTGGVTMYEQAAIGQTWVSNSKGNVRWQNWMGRQIYKYRYAGPKKDQS
jgi:hypothetical protein